MSIKNNIPLKIKRDFIKILKRKQQDIERGLDTPGWLFPPVTHSIGKDDLKGNPKKLGTIGLELFSPNTSAKELSVSNFYLKKFQKWLRGENPPQKRVRLKHERDKTIINDRPTKRKSTNPINGTIEITSHRKMDDLVFKEVENIEDDKQFALADRRSRKKHSQGKYRYSKSSITK